MQRNQLKKEHRLKISPDMLLRERGRGREKERERGREGWRERQFSTVGVGVSQDQVCWIQQDEEERTTRQH